MSTADEIQSADFLYDLQDIFKIGSGELTNIPFLKHIANYRKKIILSTGMGNLDEIKYALDVIESGVIKRKDITLLHATTMYPTQIQDVNLNALKTIRKAFNISVGFSDHTMGIEVSIAAAALGATVIEKHFTLSRDMLGPDHKCSLEPEELKALVLSIRNIEKAMGDGNKVAMDGEKKNIAFVRKSIVASKSISKGELYSEKNLATKRVGKGISSSMWNRIIGQRSNNDYQFDEIIRL
jgi:sialic acid synthase SpsE